MSDKTLKKKYLLTYLKKDYGENMPVSTGKHNLEKESNKNSNKKLKNDSPFTNIPEDIFVKICKFLPMNDVWRIGSVCTWWYRLTRSEIVCGRIDIASLNLSRLKARKFLLSLPECVKELRIGNWCSYAKKQTVSVPDLFHILRERFPKLNALIIENVSLLKPHTQFVVTSGFMLNCKVPMELQARGKFKSLRYKNGDKDADFYTLVCILQDLTILSLRSSILVVNNVVNSHIPQSRIKVLDLTNFLCTTDLTIKTLCQLPFLEELYLAGTSITINGVSIILKEVPRLKVLDLEDTVVGGETFAVLRDHGQSLVEICLGRTAVRDCDLIDVDEEAFPVLKKLCLQQTIVSEKGLKKLLLFVPSLSHVNVTRSRVKISWILDQPVYIRAKLMYDDSYAIDECNHFIKNTFAGGF